MSRPRRERVPWAISFVLTLFMCIMLSVLVITHLRRSGGTGLDMGRLHQLRAQGGSGVDRS